jgi:MIP family channel proteins
MNPNLLKACAAEFIGTFALIFVGVGAIHHMGEAPDLLGIALAQGLTIAVMVSATGAISGGHLNPAVTFGLWVGGKIDLPRSVAYWVAQLLGACVAGWLLLSLLSNQPDGAVAIVKNGTPACSAHVSYAEAVAIEAVLTFFLVFVVFGTAVDGRGPKIGGLAIGLTVTLDILFGGPLTGAAMNPARAFGPALASGFWTNQPVYWIGPLLGGAGAGLIYGRFLIRE